MLHSNGKLVFVYVGTATEWENREERSRERPGQRKKNQRKQREMHKSNDGFVTISFIDFYLFPANLW